MPFPVIGGVGGKRVFFFFGKGKYRGVVGDRYRKLYLDVVLAILVVNNCIIHLLISKVTSVLSFVDKCDKVSTGLFWLQIFGLPNLRLCFSSLGWPTITK